MHITEFYPLLAQRDFRFTTDTRLLKQGDVYFALKGPHFNGNEFAEKALAGGASIAVVDDPQLAGCNGCILVDDVLVFMQQLARYHRDRFDIPVLAIGGSNGKTTTKELVLSVLSKKYKVHGTKGNLNNLIGVPVTLLQMPADTEIAVIEIGTNTFGEIARLCEIVNPDYGLITNIGKEHLEGFGDLEGVAKEESELFYYLSKHHGLAFVNCEDEWLMRMARGIERRFTYGRLPQADCTMDVSQVMPGIKLKLGRQTVQSKLFGDYNFHNIAAAVAIGSYFKLDNESIARGIEEYVPSNNRSEIRKFGSTTVILDSYNANPSSVEAAMRSFAEFTQSGKIVVLGDMFELGDQEDIEHQRIAQLASELAFDEVVLTGPRFSRQADAMDTACFETMNEAIDYLQNMDLENTWILVKGSRGMKMEQILEIWNSTDPTA